MCADFGEMKSARTCDVLQAREKLNLNFLECTAAVARFFSQFLVEKEQMLVTLGVSKIHLIAVMHCCIVNDNNK